MPDFTQESRCLYCGEAFRWQAVIAPRNFEVRTVTGQQATAIATGTVRKSDGEYVQFEVVARCPNCRVDNKFNLDVHR